MQWMVVYVTYDVNDAHVVAGRLEVEGIKALVHRQAGAGALGITIGSLGEVTVAVPQEDYEHALALIEPDDDDEKALPDTTDKISYRWNDQADE